MDFTRRTTIPSPSGHTHPAPPAPAVVAPAPPRPPKKQEDDENVFGMSNKWLRIASVTLLFSLTVIAVCIVWLLYLGKPNEDKYVDTGKYQAVFLTSNQVYFGKIKAISDSYIDLQDIFYLNNQSSQGSSSSSSSNNSLSLVKLGCEVHGPYSEMLINRSQVTFWENLRDNGQVVTAIGTWMKQNPNGQTCSTTAPSTTTQQSTGTNTTPSNSSTTSTNSTPTTSKP